jgi:DNA-directed RNA polymerase subunit RPC12/RpoP
MLTAPSRDWSVFQQIFADHWEAFQHAHPRYQTPYYDGLVAKMLACGQPEKMGYVEYRCLQCGQGTHQVAMSCKLPERGGRIKCVHALWGTMPG